MPDPRFSERLTVPVAWWCVAGVFVVSVLVAAGFALGLWPGLLLTAVTGAVAAAVLISYGSARVVVDDEALTAGLSRIDWRWVGAVRHLDAGETRRRLGTGADARAHLVARPFIAESVEVTLADPADPHPYWLISSRRASELAAAIDEKLATTKEHR